MSSAKRAYDILRGYVNHGIDQVRGPVFEDEAEEELKAALESPMPFQSSAPVGSKPVVPEMSVDVARRLLGVDADANSAQLKESYEKFREAVDPKKFEADPAASSRAKDLQVRLDLAYSVARRELSPTAKRFEALEIID